MVGNIQLVVFQVMTPCTSVDPACVVNVTCIQDKVRTLLSQSWFFLSILNIFAHFIVNFR